MTNELQRLSTAQWELLILIGNLDNVPLTVDVANYSAMVTELLDKKLVEPHPIHKATMQLTHTGSFQLRLRAMSAWRSAFADLAHAHAVQRKSVAASDSGIVGTLCERVDRSREHRKFAKRLQRAAERADKRRSHAH